jgi:hypothetical protein
MSDLELAEIRAKIVTTEGKLALAEDAGNEALIVAYSNTIVAYSNTLTEQQREKNILLAGAVV